MTEELSPIEKRVLLALGEIGGNATPQQIFERGEFSELVQVMNGSSWLQSKGLVRHEETMRTFVSLGKEGKRVAEKGLPERRVLQAIHEAGGSLALPEIAARPDVEGFEVNISTGQLKRKDLAQITKDETGTTTLTLTEKGERVAEGQEKMADEALVHQLAEAEHEVPEEALDPEGLKAVKGRKDVVRTRDEITRVIHLTKKGKLAIERGIEVKEQISQITSEVITSGKWREAEIRPYDVDAFAPVATGGKKHPLRQIIDQIRNIFLEMGFTEIEGPYARSAFWNMDVLFTPQNHPAREMQDTFYLKKPERATDLDEDVVDRVRRAHEGDPELGSKGWRYDWSRDVAEQMLLRTHTTVDTINYLRDHPEPPVKVFSVDRVFRNEAVDATHLPEFHQVEGIVMEEGANLRMLIGLLKDFYLKMGAEDVRVRPAYFPYTEPSLEVEAFYNGEWMELGGAGIFRKEVTQAVGVEHPVLAWGLGLERIAMMNLGLTDLRELYISDVDWLRNAPLVE